MNYNVHEVFENHNELLIVTFDDGKIKATFCVYFKFSQLNGEVPKSHLKVKLMKCKF